MTASEIACNDPDIVVSFVWLRVGQLQLSQVNQSSAEGQDWCVNSCSTQHAFLALAQVTSHVTDHITRRRGEKQVVLLLCSQH